MGGHLIDRTLDEIFAALRQPQSQRRSTRCYAYAALRADCQCGRNPLFAYFLANEQTVLGALMLMQAETPNLIPANRDTAVIEVNFVMRSIARHEVQAFCAVCQQRASVAVP